MNQQESRNSSMGTHWVGADVGKDAFDVGLVRYDQHYPDTPLCDIPADTFACSAQGVQAFVSWLDAQGLGEAPVRVVMEATGDYSINLAVWMLEQRASLAPAIANPRQTHNFIESMGVRNKTDRLDARALGFYGVERNPMAYETPSPEMADLRSLSRYRETLVRQRTALKNQMHKTNACAYVVKDQKKRLRQLNRGIEGVEKEMKALVDEHSALKGDVELLISIYGVAFISATTILAELGDLRRFERARPLTAFAGMSPRQHQSGSSIRGRTRLCKRGNPRIRQCLYLSAMVAIRGDNEFRQTYQRLLAQGKPRMVALASVMRKMLVVMRAILISGQPYRPLGISS